MLPEYLTDQTEQTIRKRMFGNIPPDLDKAEGSYIWDALTPVAIELELAAIWAQEVLRRGFAETTFGEYLTMRAAEHGVDRKPAVKASGYVTFTGRPGTVIPAGTRVGTASDEAVGAIWFVTLSEVVIPDISKATVLVEAEQAGLAGNIPAEAIEITAMPIPYLETVINHEEMTGGAEEESDADLLSRYYIKVRTPGNSGNKADYRYWAREVPGVSGVQVISLWAGPGTVKLILLGEDMLPASEAVINAAQDYIDPVGSGEGKAPVGASVTIEAATPLEIDIVATVVLDGTRSLEEVAADFEAAIREYLADLTRKHWGMGAPEHLTHYVSYARIGATLIENIDGVMDYLGLTLNDDTKSVTMEPGEVAVMGTVALNEE